MIIRTPARIGRSMIWCIALGAWTLGVCAAPVDADDTVRFRVIDNGTGAAIESVRVLLRRTPLRVGTPALGETASDDNGEFELTKRLVDHGGYAVELRHEGYAPLALTTARLSELGTVRLIAGTRLRGRLSTAEGTPTAGRVVVILESVPDSVRELGSEYLRGGEFAVGDDGRFDLWVIGDAVRLVALVGDASPYKSELIFPTPEPYEFRLPPPPAPPRLEFCTVDRKGQPIPEVVVGTRRLGDAIGNSDERGVFPLRQDVDVLFFSHPDYTRVRLDGLSSRQGRIEVVMPPARWIEFSLSDPDGAPLTVDPIWLETEGDEPERLWLDRMDGEDGPSRFRSPALPPGTEQVLLLTDVGEPLSLSVPARDGAIDLGTVVWALGESLEVSISDGDGLPISGVEVRLRRRRSRWRELQAGHYRATGLEVGDDVVIASKSGYRSAEIPVVIGSKELAPPHIELLKLIPIIGRLVDESGHPCPRGDLEVVARERNSMGTLATLGLARSDDSGRFELSVVRSADTIYAQVILRYSRPGSFPRSRVLAITPTSERIDIGDLVVMRGRSITGTVADLDAKAIDGASVSLSDGQSTTTTKSDANGMFAIHDLPEGEYHVIVRRSGYGVPDQPGIANFERDVEIGTEDIEIAIGLAPLTVQSGTLVDWRQQAIADANIEATFIYGRRATTAVTQSDGNGQFSFSAFSGAPDRVQYRVLVDSVAQSYTLPFQNAPVELVLTEAGIAEFEFAYDDGQAVPGNTAHYSLSGTKLSGAGFLQLDDSRSSSPMLPAGNVDYVFLVEGAYPVTRRIEIVKSQVVRERIVVERWPVFEHRVRIIDALTGEPVPTAFFVGPIDSNPIRADAEGWIDIDSRWPGELEGTVFASDYADRTLRLRHRPGRPTLFAIERGVLLPVVVVDANGRPAAAVQLRRAAQSRQVLALTDVDGRLPDPIRFIPGESWIAVPPSGNPSTFVIEADDNTTEVRIVLPKR